MDLPNPYQSPLADSVPPPERLRFYTATGVMWATFLGSFLGGSILMAINYRRLGRPGRAWLTVAAGLAATFVLMIFVVWLPESVPIPRFVIVAVQMGAMYFIATEAQSGT